MDEELEGGMVYHARHPGIHRSNRSQYHPMNSSPWHYRENYADDVEALEYMHGMVVGREKAPVKALVKAHVKPQREAGVSLHSVKQAAKKGLKIAEAIGSATVSGGLDVAFNEGISDISIAAGAEMGVPPLASRIIGRAVGKVLRKEVRKKTGFGSASGVGRYEPEGGFGFESVKKIAKKVPTKKIAKKIAKRGVSIGADVLLKAALPEVTGYLGEKAGVNKSIAKAVGKHTGERLRESFKDHTGLGRRPSGGNPKNNPWVAHVRRFAVDHGLNYAEALKHPQCKALYRK